MQSQKFFLVDFIQVAICSKFWEQRTHQSFCLQGFIFPRVSLQRTGSESLWTKKYKWSFTQRFKELGQKVDEQKSINEVLHININSWRFICLQGHVLKQVGHQVDKLQKYEKVNFARHCCGCRRTYKLLEFTCFRP